MTRLGQRDVRLLLDCVQRLYAVQDVARFPGVILRVLPALVPHDRSSYNSFDARTKRVEAFAEPRETPRFPGDVEVLARHIGEHPLFIHQRRTRDGRAMKLSDFLTRTQLHNNTQTPYVPCD